ncbi:MAG: xanthine dehydrogenase molybdopterin binding subunit [Pirellulales bacterium]
MSHAVGKSLPHDSAHGHVTGQAAYLDDLPPVAGELQVGYVGSPVAHGELISIDTQAALKIPGVVACYTANDIPGRNHFGLIVADEPFLAEKELLYLSQPVAVIAAETVSALDLARQAVRVQCCEKEPLLDLESAIQKKQFLGTPLRVARGDAATHLDSAPHLLQGQFISGGQEQFYLESQAAIAYPGELQQLTIHSSTQGPTEIQAVVAEVMGIGQHQVVCRCKRMGGAFGGKETQAAIPALMAALVALKTGRSARVIYNKDDDMRVTGKRHEYFTRWQVGFDNTGRIIALRLNFFSNGGAVTDLSPAVLERSLLHADNCYYLPHVELTGQICATNLPPNTAFRGFGGPQAMAVCENILESIAQHLGLDAFSVRTRNLYGIDNRNETPYGQIFQKNHLPEIFAALADSADYPQRREDITQFNATSPTTLRGLAITGIKFGISFTSKFLNQANALVNIYTDGSIQVSTGATEMGQGVNVKIQQLVADQFGLDVKRVQMMITSTEKNNNTSPTAASAGTDLNGAAAVRACQKIRERLQPFAASRLALENGVDVNGELGNGKWDPSAGQIEFADGYVYDRRRPQVRLPFGQLCDQARRERIDLGARGFFATPGIDFNRETGRGNPFFYYTQGAAVAEVAIDRFTGTLTAQRVDLLIDIGESVNPGVDRGQIIGAFVQGMGWVTTEALVYDDRGDLLSHSPTTYKIPAVTDLPKQFHVSTFDNHDNVQNVRRSKGVGEPPLMLGLSVWAATKNALSHLAPNKYIDLKLPATGEEVLRCMTEITKNV